MKRRGVDSVEMIWHGSQSDPELKYEGIIANYWTIEDSLYEDFIAELQENDMYELYKSFTEIDRDSCFSRWLKKNEHLIGDLFGQIKENNIL